MALYFGGEKIAAVTTVVVESTVVYEYTYDPKTNPAATVQSITERLKNYVLETAFTTLSESVSALSESVNGLKTSKQNALVFDGVYNAETNKAATVQTVIDKIAEIVANAPEDLNTIEELAAWIKAHPEDVAAMNAGIQTNAAAISELQAQMGDVSALLDSINGEVA